MKLKKIGISLNANLIGLEDLETNNIIFVNFFSKNKYNIELFSNEEYVENPHFSYEDEEYIYQYAIDEFLYESIEII